MIELNKKIENVAAAQLTVNNKIVVDGRHILKSDSRKPKVEVLDTKFVSGVAKSYPKFSKAANRDEYQFSKPVAEKLGGIAEGGCQHLFTEADILYLPFNLDSKHWVYLAVYLHTSNLEVLGCNVHLTTYLSMEKEFRPIAVILYLCRKVGGGGNESMANTATNQLAIDRALGMPQISSQNDSGLVAIFLILAHAIG
ncbi:hypothetical protein EUTSA_v10029131mg [Eutrema salsugineum]|uniref:Ubiquitin-like protease family profile domain-containing protein n=1 Tax=Eutrema salsugineum TaxID=72664 RepID=V4L515_EUTSA|nr:hypothetical protein EUTSA_v10029131mg [Eutrema salsugineum]